MENTSHKKQMEQIYSIARDVIKNWMVVLCIALSVSFLSYIGASILYQPTYTSSTTFVVSAKGSSMGAYANESKTQELTEIFQTVMDSQILQKKVAESLGMESFPGTVSIAIVPETNLLTVSVKSGSPEISFRLLRTMLEYYPEVSTNVLGEVVLEVFEEPNYPSGVDNPFNGRDVMEKGFLVAAAFMVALFAVLSYLKDSVKGEEDVNDKLDTKLFGVLEHEHAYRNVKAFLKRKRKKLLLSEPAVGFGFVETIKKMRTKLLYHCSKDGSKVLLVTSTAKQEGKTTVAANLALSMAMRGKNVLLIEGDFRKSDLADTLGVDVPAGAGIGANLSSIGDIKRLVFNMEGKSLYLLVNSASHSRSTEFLISDKFDRFMNEMRETMDFIIIDGPSAKGRADAEVWARKADASLLVVRTNMVKAPFINDTIDMLNAYGQGVIGCVLNDVYSDVSLVGYGYGYGYGYNRYSGRGYGRYGRYGRYGQYGYYGKDKSQEAAVPVQEEVKYVLEEVVLEEDITLEENEGVKNE